MAKKIAGQESAAQAPEVSGPSKGEQYASWFLRKWYWFVTPVVLVVVIFLVLGIRESYSRNLEDKAYERLRKAETASELMEVHNKYSQTNAGMSALQQAADQLYEEGKYSESRKLYQQYISKYSGNPLLPWIQNCVGFTLESEEKYDEAIAAYNNVLERHQGYIYLEDQLKFNIGRCHEMKGDVEIAKSYYKQLIPPEGSRQQSKPSFWAIEARSRLELIDSMAEKQD